MARYALRGNKVQVKIHSRKIFHWATSIHMTILHIHNTLWWNIALLLSINDSFPASWFTGFHPIRLLEGAVNIVMERQN